MFNSTKPAKLLDKAIFNWWNSHGSYGKSFM